MIEHMDSALWVWIGDVLTGGRELKKSIETWTFVLVVVRLGHRFLVVQERKHQNTWYLPAGRVEPGETFEEAARRETLEEAGIHISIDGILRIEHTPEPDGSARLRVIYLASPVDDTPPKSIADEESLQARWVTLAELQTMRTRGRGFIELFASTSSQLDVYPRDLIRLEEI